MKAKHNKLSATAAHRPFRRPPAERRWLQVIRKTLRLKDHQGKKIDFGILRLVVALRALGFKTIASCEGHINRGQGTPSVDLALGEPARLRRLLAKFYRQHPVPSEQQLILLPSRRRGIFRLTPDGNRAATLQDSERNPYLSRCRWGAEDFAEFLQREYFATAQSA